MSYVVLWYRKGPANYVGSLMDYVARGYSPALGRFISADTIVPGAGNPAALNRYMYVGANPLGRIDPLGHCSGDANDAKNADAACWAQLAKVQKEFSNIAYIQADAYDLEALQAIYEALRMMSAYFGSENALFKAIGSVEFLSRDSQIFSACASNIDGCAVGRSVGVRGIAVVPRWIVHELSHVYDFNALPTVSVALFWSLDSAGSWVTRAPGQSSTEYGNHSAAEDFAESVTWAVFTDNGVSHPDFVRDGDANRQKAVYNVKLYVQWLSGAPLTVAPVSVWETQMPIATPRPTLAPAGPPIGLLE